MPWIGVAVRDGSAQLLDAIERPISTRVDLFRAFVRWDSPMPSPDLAEILDAGHSLHLSIRPVTLDGTVIPWGELATAEPGEAVYGQLLAWVDRVIALEGPTFVTLNHEPETVESRANGTAEEYRAAWRRFSELLDERGGDDVQTVLVLTGGAFSDGQVDRWYPGDDVVDIVGADVYNWSTCQGTDRAWMSFSELIEAPLEFARAHGKPLAIPEFASIEGDPGQKAAWIDEASQTLAADPVRDQIAFVAWFDVTAPGGTWPDCVWDHDSSESSDAAFNRFIIAMTGD